MTILWWIIVGLVAGWATGKIMGGAGYGVIMDIVVGIIGALIGGFIMSHLGMAASGGMIYTIVEPSRAILCLGSGTFCGVV